jgi:L-iditol 2-dehydrogenase
MVFHHVPCGDCYYCRKRTFAQCAAYKNVGCTAGFEPSGGGFAEYVRVMDWIVRRGLVKIPADVPFEQAAFIEPLNTTYKGVRSLHLEPDETVLVIGQGPIGILLATLARRTGAKVVTSDLYPERHAVARSFGLEHPIDASKEDVVKRIREESDGRGADAVLLAVGGNALIRTAIDAARPGGRIMLFAQTQHGDATFDPAVVCMDEKTLLGSYSSSAEIQDEGVRIVVDGYTQGYDLTRLISHRFPLSQAAEAIAFASEPHPDSMKVMIVPGS